MSFCIVQFLAWRYHSNRFNLNDRLNNFQKYSRPRDWKRKKKGETQKCILRKAVHSYVNTCTCYHILICIYLVHGYTYVYTPLSTKKDTKKSRVVLSLTTRELSSLFSVTKRSTLALSYIIQNKKFCRICARTLDLIKTTPLDPILLIARREVVCKERSMKEKRRSEKREKRERKRKPCCLSKEK